MLQTFTITHIKGAIQRESVTKRICVPPKHFTYSYCMQQQYLLSVAMDDYLIYLHQKRTLDSSYHHIQCSLAFSSNQLACDARTYHANCRPGSPVKTIDPILEKLLFQSFSNNVRFELFQIAIKTSRRLKMMCSDVHWVELIGQVLS